MVATRSMVIHLALVKEQVRLIKRRHRRITRPAYRFLPGPAPRPEFIQLEINNVEDADVEYVHFRDGHPIPRYIDLTED